MDNAKDILPNKLLIVAAHTDISKQVNEWYFEFLKKCADRIEAESEPLVWGHSIVVYLDRLPDFWNRLECRFRDDLEDKGYKITDVVSQGDGGTLFMIAIDWYRQGGA